MHVGTYAGKNSNDDLIIKSARKFLVNQQSDFDKKGRQTMFLMVELVMVRGGLYLIYPILILQWKLSLRKKNLQKQ